MNNDFLKAIFSLLSSNLSFPYYQGERRIDIFINLFIEEIIQQNTEYTDAVYLVPEFPIKKSDVSDHAAHIDYLMYSASQNTAILVELKTDDSSLIAEQIALYLNSADFISLYKNALLIKMNEFADKKATLHKKLETIEASALDTCAIKVVVLKPSITPADLKMAETHAGKLIHLPLSKLEIKSNYQEEWELLKDLILKTLRTKSSKAFK